jgi:Programmed cell death protein 2, C-terminal putative domain
MVLVPSHYGPCTFPTNTISSIFVPLNLRHSFIFHLILHFYDRPIISLERQQNQVSNHKQQGKGNRPTSSKKSNVVSIKKNKNEIYGYEQPIPICHYCGTPLRFELQLLSSLLHVLHVDDVATNSFTSISNRGGMDWGNICIYTCPIPITKCPSNDAFCVVQDSIDHIHVPSRNHLDNNATVIDPHENALAGAAAATAVVVIPEDSQFNEDDDDDGIVLVGDEYDDEDDNSVW